MKDEQIIYRDFGQKNLTYGMLIKSYKDKGISPHDDDEISMSYDEGFQSENNSWDGGAIITVNRKRPYTDEEKKEMERRREEQKSKARASRYANYLKLKKEFEDD